MTSLTGYRRNTGKLAVIGDLLKPDNVMRDGNRRGAQVRPCPAGSTQPAVLYGSNQRIKPSAHGRGVVWPPRASLAGCPSAPAPDPRRRDGWLPCTCRAPRNWLRPAPVCKSSRHASPPCRAPSSPMPVMMTPVAYRPAGSDFSARAIARRWASLVLMTATTPPSPSASAVAPGALREATTAAIASTGSTIRKRSSHSFNALSR